MRHQRRHWYEYLWIASAAYFTLGFFNIVFAWLGVVAFLVPLAMAAFWGSKGYCNKYCGRGHLFLQIGNTLGWTRRRPAPRLLSSKWFRYGFLAFFMSFFVQMLVVTYITRNECRFVCLVHIFIDLLSDAKVQQKAQYRCGYCANHLANRAKIYFMTKLERYSFGLAPTS